MTTESDGRPTVTLEDAVLSRSDRFSLYNSPYPSHDDGCAIDLYPDAPPAERANDAPSPVSGTVLETRTVRAPPKPYAVAHDHLIAIECDGPPSIAGLVCRILHVDPKPGLVPGALVEAGESLGTLVRSGFFAPWVDNHLHVGFRTPDQNYRRASGSLPIRLATGLEPLSWDGLGTVVETGETYAVLDAPTHPDLGTVWAGIGVDGSGVLDGGLPHYDGGGRLGFANATTGEIVRDGDESPVKFLGERIGTAVGRTIDWDDIVVTANGDPVTGLSLFVSRSERVGAKVICPTRSFAMGDRICVRIRPRSAIRPGKS